MKKILTKDAVEALVVSLMFMLFNVFLVKLEYYFSIAFFIIILLIGFMVFLSIDMYNLDKEKKEIFPIVILIEGILLIETTGMIMTDYVRKNGSIVTFVIWLSLFLGIILTTFIGNKIECKQ